jgi:hypothetical protein
MLDDARALRNENTRHLRIVVERVKRRLRASEFFNSSLDGSEVR